MNITDIRIRQIKDGGRMKAIASVTFDGDFVVHDMKIIEGTNGLFLAMPSRRIPSGAFRDIAHPINSKTRNELEEAVINEFHKVEQEEAEKPETDLDEEEEDVFDSDLNTHQIS